MADARSKRLATQAHMDAIAKGSSVALDRVYGKDLRIDLKPGMAWVLYSDKGPGGPCGQSMRTTCPHTELHIYKDEDSMRAAVEAKDVGRNKKADLLFGVVDQYTSAGVFSVVTHN